MSVHDPVNVLGTPSCTPSCFGYTFLSVYPTNDMVTHQYRLCTQLKIDTLKQISKHELLVIHGYTQLLVRVPSECNGYTSNLSVCVPSKMIWVHIISTVYPTKDWDTFAIYLPWLISKHELLVIVGTPDWQSMYPVNVMGTPTCLSV